MIDAGLRGRTRQEFPRIRQPKTAPDHRAVRFFGHRSRRQRMTFDIYIAA
jgi:hypothetical protein